MEKYARIPPAVNQIEVGEPYDWDAETMADEKLHPWCQVSTVARARQLASSRAQPSKLRSVIPPCHPPPGARQTPSGSDNLANWRACFTETQQPTIVAYSQSHNIALEAYSPLVQGKKAQDPTLLRIAKETGKSWAQVLIRWSLQRG